MKKRCTWILTFFIIVVLSIGIGNSEIVEVISSTPQPLQTQPSQSDTVVVIALNQSVIRDDFFAALQGKEVHACSCADTVNVLTLKNTGTVPSFYTITLSGEAAPQVTLVPEAVHLEPNEQRQIFVHINTPCKTYTTQELELSIQSHLGVIKKVKQQLTYVPCTNLELRAQANAYINCPCTPTKYTFDVVNTGDFPEVYALNLDLPREQYSLSASELFILAGKRENVFAYVTLPCDVYGVQQFAVAATAKTSGFTAQLPLYLDASSSCYQFNIQRGEVYPLVNETASYQFSPATTNTYKVCEQGTYFIPLRITNPSTLLNEHVLELDSPDWASLNYDRVALWPKQEADSAIVLAPYEQTEGNYTLVINTTTSRGQISQVSAFNVEVVNCSPSEEEGEETSLITIIGAGILGILFIGVIALVVVFLTQKRPSEFKLEQPQVQRPRWVKIVLIALTVVVIIALILISFYMYYRLVVVPEMPILNITNTSAVRNISGNISVPGPGLSGMLNASLMANATAGNITAHTLTTIKRYALITGAGIGGIIIVMLLAGGIWYYLRKRKQKKQSEPVAVKESKKKAPKEEKASKVKKAALEAPHEKAMQTTSVQSQQHRKGLSTAWKVAIWCMVILLILGLVGTGVYMAREPLKAAFNTTLSSLKRTPFNATLQNGTVPATTPAQPVMPDLPKTENFTFRMWPKNTQKVINLSKHVRDPDNDALTFSFTPVQNISIEVKNGVATVTPAKDFIGIRHVTFRAGDSKGGEVTLPIMTLVVTDADEEKPFYVGWIVAGVIVLGILVTAVVLVARNKKE